MIKDYLPTDSRSELVTVRPSSQNWGTMIGVGVILLFASVIVINLAAYQVSITTLSAHPRAKIVSMTGIIITIGISGWLLWRLRYQQSKSRPQSIHHQPGLHNAHGYIAKIESLLEASENSHEQHLLNQIHIWWQTIEAIAVALNTLTQHDTLLQRDFQQLPNLITDLEQQVSTESNDLLHTDLTQILTQRRNQQQALNQLQITRRRAEIQIDRTISVLGTIYSQLLTYHSTCHIVDYQQLANNVGEEVERLQDYLEALDEVKGLKAYSVAR